MNFETILYEIEDKILTITLNRPDRLNAFTGQMMDELISAFNQAGEDDDWTSLVDVRQNAVGDNLQWCVAARHRSGQLS